MEEIAQKEPSQRIEPMRRDAWQALSDPTRRKIIEELTDNPMTVNELADRFDISRPGVSKQVRFLEDSDMLQVEQKGRQRILSLNPKPMAEVFKWVQNYERFWMSKLDALEDFLESED